MRGPSRPWNETRRSSPDPTRNTGSTPPALRAEWVDEARRLGHDPASLTAEAITFQGWPDGRVHDEDLIDEALLHASDEASTWLRADLARHLATIIETNRCPTATAVVEEIDRLSTLAEQRCTALGPELNDTSRHRADGRPVSEHVTDRRFTTPAVLRQEEELQGWAASNTRPVAPASGPQRASAVAIAGHDQLVVVVGPAGTGKTHTTAVSIGALQARGRPVVGLAPSGKAADVLATEAQCPTDTVAGFLTRHRGRPTPWPAGTAVILDEAGMAATEDLARLVDLVRVNRWRLVAVGDPEQLPSVARGGVFAHRCDTLPHHALDTPRRFTHDWEAAASLGLRAGRPDAVAAYAAHRRLQVAHPALVATQVARAHRGHEAAGRTVAITTNTAETARAINREIQWLRHPRSADGVELHDGTRAHEGDAIATRRNDPIARTDQGEKVRNRQAWTVTATHADGAITARHDQRGSVILPADYVARHVELGWAVTGYGNQGDTVDIGIAVLEGSASRNQAYVAMTRGRQANHALVVDADDTTDPGERLTDIITRPSTVESALAVQARLHREAGLEPPDHQRSAHRPLRLDPAPPEPTPMSEADRLHQEKIDAARARLDRAQHHLTHPGPDRGLSL